MFEAAKFDLIWGIWDFIGYMIGLTNDNRGHRQQGWDNLLEGLIYYLGSLTIDCALVRVASAYCSKSC